MSRDLQPRRLDVAFFAGQATALRGEVAGPAALREFPRLADGVPDLAAGLPDQMLVHWHARGELRTAPGGAPQNWLHLEAGATLPQTCQRCLQPVAVPLAFERAYRFVADEAEAEREDVDAEEDLLVINRQFDLLELVEDELLMELPLVARHDECPVDLPMAAQTADFVDESTALGDGAEPGKPAKPNPFAVLASLKLPRGS